MVSYAIISSVGGYDRQGRAIARKHILYNKKTSVVLKPISTPILLRCIVTNQIYPTEIIEYNLSDILTKGKYNYTIELDLNTGQLIAQ